MTTSRFGAFLHLDFETFCILDLPKHGAYKYIEHPSFRVLCVAWAFDDGPVKSEILPAKLPDEIYEHVEGGGIIAAHNTAFEQAILEEHYNLDVYLSDCTMQRALYAGLPPALADAGDALHLAIRKDRVAHALMMSMCKPHKNGTIRFLQDPQALVDLAEYCEQDVRAERELGKHLPRLPPRELRIARLDRETNIRGIRLDENLVDTMLWITDEALKVVNVEGRRLTQNNVRSIATEGQKLIDWLATQGVDLPDVTKETIAETLETAEDAGLDENVIKVLRLRKIAARASVRKLKAMLDTVCADGRIRNTIQYYGAGRTGRASGRKPQFQNLPRGTIKDIDAILPLIRNEPHVDADYLRLFHGEPLEVISSGLRGCLIPDDGHVFMSFDLRQIEARTLAWLAGQSDILKEFADGRDVYTFVSEQLGLGSRLAGKVAVLGLGYGMGHVAFVDFAKANGLTLSTVESNNIVTAWRDANAKTRQFWWDLDAAAKNAIRNPGVEQRVRGIRIATVHANNFSRSVRHVMLIKLPNGRQLWYRNPRLERDPVKPQYEALIFDGVSQKSKKWEPLRTWGSKLAENVTQAVARDIIFEAALKIDDTLPRPKLVLSVHDELVYEVRVDDEKDGLGVFNDIMELIHIEPDWATGLPIAAEGKILSRYSKE